MTRSIPAACSAQAVFDSPLGAMLLARTEHGLAGAWFAGQKYHPGALEAPHAPRDPLLRDAAQQLSAYFAGLRGHFELPLDLRHGTTFQQRVWQALLGIAGGRTCSYGELARQLGAPLASRAVGAAVGRNPVSVIVPCHRVVGHAGSLTGYAGGIDRKRALLALEKELH